MARTRTPVVTPAGELVQQARRHAGDELERLAVASRRLTEMVTSLGAPPTPAEVTAALATQLADDAIRDDIPTGRADHIGEQAAAHQHRIDTARVLNHAQGIIRSRIAEATQAVADTALAWLHQQLTDLLTLAPDEIADQYREIRLAQRVLTADARGHHGNVTGDLHMAGTTRTPTDVDYLVAVGLAHEHKTFTANGVRTRYEPEPWPAHTDSDDPIPSSDPAAYIAWLTERGDAWIPTGSELEQALATRRRAVHQGVPVDQLTDEPQPQRRGLVVTVDGDSVRRDLARRQRARANGDWP